MCNEGNPLTEHVQRVIDTKEIGAKKRANKGVLILSELVVGEKKCAIFAFMQIFYQGRRIASQFVPLTDSELRYITRLIMSLHIDTTRSLLHH